MSDGSTIHLTVSVVAVELECSHIIYITERLNRTLRKTGHSFYCTVCGSENGYVVTNDQGNLKSNKETDKKRFADNIVTLFRKNKSEKPNP